jgi:predicted permease
MLLMRASSRVKEVAIRLALGATRGRLVRQLLTESALLGIFGGAAGLLIALWISSAFANIEVPLPVILTLDMRLDWRVLLYALALSIATGVLFGLAPALKASRRDLITSIKDEAPTLGIERKYFTLRNFFVVTQVAVSIILLISGGLVIRAIGRGQQIDPGFNTENTAMAAMDISLGGYEEEAPGRAFFERLSQRIASQPGVQTVALTSQVPYGLWGTDFAARIRLPELTPEQNEELPVVDFAAVTSNYFDAMEIPILQGRNFGNQDGPDSLPVLIVNETMAMQILGAANPIGRALYLRRRGEEESAEVIGVARDTHMELSSMRGESKPYFYRPFSQQYSESMVVVARTGGSPEDLPGIFRSELRALEPGIPVYEATTMKEHHRISFFVHRMTAFFLSSFGILNMVLASIGLYGLVGYSVTRRTREVGIRIALGAERKQVVRMVLKHGIGLVFAGLVIGLPIGVLLMKPLSNFLLGIPTYDFITLAVVAPILVAVALSASYIPARRAARLDPMTALRYE